MGNRIRTWTLRQIMKAWDKSHFGGGGGRDLSQFEAELDRLWDVSEEKRMAALRDDLKELRRKRATAAHAGEKDD